MKSKKGSQFEREICKVLSLWWSDQERDDLFWRTPGSGARATVRRKQGKQTTDATADLMATHKSAKPLTKSCLFEMKRGYSDKHKIVKNKKTKKLSVRKVSYGLEVLSILDKKPQHKDPILLQWWKKVEEERIATRRKYSFIIFRRDAKESCIVMDEVTYKFLWVRNGYNTYREIRIKYDIIDQLSPLVIMKLEEFLCWCNPKCFLNIRRKLKRRKTK